MEATCSKRRLDGNTGFICKDNGEGGENGVLLDREVAAEESFERGLLKVEPDSSALKLSKKFMRSFSQKLKKKMSCRSNGDEEGNGGRISSRCLGFYIKGGGCRVGADTSEDLLGRGDGLARFADGNFRRKSSAGEECMGHGYGCVSVDTGFRRSGVSGFVSRIDEAGVDCFSYGVAEKLWRRNSRKVVESGKLSVSRNEIESPFGTTELQFSLPDDVLEICLVRVPLTTLMNVRLVCKKWRSLTMTSRFMQMRYEFSYQSQWLFLFGIAKDGYSAGKIQALDVSLDKWHMIDAGIIRGRFLFSVAGLGSSVYIVGGCSSLAKFGRVEKGPFKTHRGVLVFKPLIGSWSKAAPMKSARSSPVLGVFEINSGSVKLGGELGRLAVECGTSNFVKQERDQSEAKGTRRFVLIAVGGQGSWNEPLDSGEIYDPITNRWMEIARFPSDFGVACTGAVCNGKFYVYSESDKLAAYDLENGIWVRIQTTRSPSRLHEYFPKLVSCNDRLFIICVSWCERDGQSNRREEAIRKLWELDVMYHAWTEISKHPDAPMDWNAAFVADRDRIFGLEMFKIFGQVLDFVTVCSISDSDSPVNWSRMSRKLVAQDLDASSCMTKSMVVLNL